MAKIIPGRVTAASDQPFVVFIIGMRINRLWQFWKWLPVARAMGPMLRELFRHPEKGLLSAEFFLYWPGVAIVQYWRSFEHLERFARSPEDPHLPAWRHFNKALSASGAVGIWHETYRVDPGNFEAIYGNMPAFGLARATQLVPASAAARRETARQRIGGHSDPAVPSPEQRASND